MLIMLVTMLVIILMLVMLVAILIVIANVKHVIMHFNSNNINASHVINYIVKLY